MESPELLARMERQPDGSWICRESAAIETQHGTIRLAPGQHVFPGRPVEGFDVAEYLEQLGAQFGS